MKSPRIPAFSVRSSILAAVVTAASGTVYGQTLYFDGSSSDWSAASAWSTANNATTPDPANPPGAAGAVGANPVLGTTALTGVRTISLNGDYTIGTLSTANLDNIVTVQGGGTNRTLTLNSGFSHVRGGLTLGSVTDGQKVDLRLGNSQTWTSSTAGAGTLQAMFVLNNVNNGTATAQTLTLSGTNTGTKIDGSISNGSGVLGLTKSAAGTWTINGPVTYTGPTTVSAGTLRFLNTPGFASSAVSVAAAGTLSLATGGTTGMSDAKLATIVKTGSFSAGSTFQIETVGGTFLTGLGALDVVFNKAGAGELTLLGVNSRNRVTNLTAGTLRLRDLQSGGVPSPIGASSNAASNLVFSSGARLTYDGPATTTDRLFTLGGNATIDSSGTGPIDFTNTGTHPASSGNLTAARTVTLAGSNQGDNRFFGTFTTNSNTGLLKRGGGSWTLRGPALGADVLPYAATARVDHGKMTFDFVNGDPMRFSTLLLNGGEVVLKGGSVTSKTIGTLNLGGPIVTAFHLKLENMALTATTMSTSVTQRNDLIDLSGPGSNSLTVNALGGTLGVVNGIIMTNATTNAGRASIVLKAQDGTYGFLALSNGTSGTAQKFGPLTERMPGTLVMNSDTTNFLLNSGTYAGSGNLVFSTATLDTTLGPISLNVGGDEIRPIGFGKAMLFTGANNVTITGNFGNNDAGDDTAIWFHNYLQGTSRLNLDVGLGGANQTVIFGGSGLTHYSGSGFVGNFVLTGGVFRYTKDQFISLGAGSPTFKVGTGSVLEVGARLQDSSITQADLIKNVGSTVGGIRFYGEAGLSAYHTTPGSKRVAYFSTITFDDWTGDAIVAPQELTWGTNYFMTVSESEPTVDGENAFHLSSPVSNAMIEVQNTIQLNAKPRTVDVANGSETIDARLSGSLMGDTGAGLIKKGPGTLQLTGINFYKGETRVMEGTLMIDGSSLDHLSRLWIDSGATLHIAPSAVNTSAVHVSAVFIDGVQYFGTITHPSIVGGGTLISDAPLTPYAQWVVDKALSTVQSAPTYDADFDGIRNLVEYAVGSEPKTPNGSVFAITGSAPRQIKFNHPTGRTDITIYVESSPTLAAPWTTIATSTVGAAFTSSAANVTASEVSNQVTVTDSRTPAATVMFYRLRVEK